MKNLLKHENKGQPIPTQASGLEMEADIISSTAEKDIGLPGLSYGAVSRLAQILAEIARNSAKSQDQSAA